MAANKELLVLIDGSSYFYRAFHALPPLSNSKGMPTGAVYGVLNMIKRLIKDYQPTYLGVVFDAKGKTFRDDLYPEYKANRDAMPEDLRCQFEPLMAVIKALGYPLLVIDGVEADDVIGTLAVQATNQNIETVISTGDKDMAQCVNEHVSLINTMSNKEMDIDGVKEKFGIGPELIVDYLTLIGDKVDNVPGVNKVGPKTAVKWLDEYKSLDGIMQNADAFKGKVGEYLRESLAHLPLSKTLVTIKDDVELNMQVKELISQEPDNAKLTELYRELELKTWLNEVLTVAEETNTVNANYEMIFTESDFNRWLEKLSNSEYFAFDTETNSLDARRAELVGLSFAVESGEAAYVPCTHDYPDAPTQLSRDWVLAKLKPLLENDTKKKVGQNLKYDRNVLRNYGITLNGIKFDTMLESYVYNSTAVRHDMDSLALKYLGRSTTHFEDIAGKGVKQLTFNQVELDKAAPYAAEDADITLQLHEKLSPMLLKEKGLQRVFAEIEMPLLPVLADMEYNGVLIDADILATQSESLSKRLVELEAEAHKLAGEEFNLSSPKQIQEILFVKLSIPVLQKTPKGAPSTAEPVLQELAYDYPLPKIILEHRSLSKLKSTYTDALPEQINPQTGRVHTSYNQAVASTGRLSSTAPNLQNIPIRTDEGRRVRQAFIAPEGYKIVAADYSQIELRIMAHLSQDETLLKAFANGWDVHKATAAEVFGVPLEEVTTEQRRKSKAINFGLIYGMSAFGLAKQIETTRDVAQKYMNMYFTRYPGVKRYMEETRELAHKTGYVETLLGRRLYLPEINARNVMRQRAAERTAINAPMQGTAADIIKMAMLEVDGWLKLSDVNATMIMQVHDELVFEVKAEDVDKLISEVQQAMCNVIKLDVPLSVGVGIGDNWDEAH